MDHIQILKRSWKILWSYRTLWVFGIILALTTSGGSGQGNASSSADNWSKPSGSGWSGPWNELGDAFNALGERLESMAPTDTSGWIWFGISVLCLVLVLAAISMVFQYLSRTALIRMVDHYEQSGEQVSWRQGFRLGWSRAAFRLFLIDLALYLPLALAALVMILCPAIPLIMAVSAGREPSIAAIITLIGFAFLTIFLVAIIGILLALSIKFIRRESVLAEAGVIESIRQGWGLVRSNFVDILLMGLIVVGVNIGLFIVTLPLALLLLGIGALTGGGLGFMAYAAINAAGAQVAAIITALVIGISLFILILAIPMTFVGGLKETYFSTVWTLAYREVQPFGGVDALPGGEGDGFADEEELEPEAEEEVAPQAEQGDETAEG